MSYHPHIFLKPSNLRNFRSFGRRPGGPFGRPGGPGRRPSEWLPTLWSDWTLRPESWLWRFNKDGPGKMNQNDIAKMKKVQKWFIFIYLHLLVCECPWGLLFECIGAISVGVKIRKMTWELVINFSMNQIQLMFYHYSKWLKTATENRTILKILQVTANITTQETKIFRGFPTSNSRFRIIFPCFFPKKKWMISPKKKMVEKLQLRRQLFAFVPRPRLLEAISAWRPGKGRTRRGAHLWPIYGTPLVSEVGELQQPKNSGDLTVCETGKWSSDCKTWWLRPIKTGVFHSYIKLPKGISTLDMIDIPPTYARLAGYRNPSFAKEISSMS